MESFQFSESLHESLLVLELGSMIRKTSSAASAHCRQARLCHSQELFKTWQNANTTIHRCMANYWPFIRDTLQV